jgi:hypothetical protein
MLEMLSYIDPMDFYKRYLIPYLESCNVISDNKIIIKEKYEVQELIDNWVIGMDGKKSDKMTALSQYVINGNEVSNYFMGLGHAAVFRGIEIDDNISTMHVFRNCSADITSFYKVSKPMTFKRTDEIAFGRDLDWVRMFDIKSAIKDFDKLVVEPFYESYILTVDLVQKFIDEEYVRKIESDSVVTEMLNDMGY